ncbi:MAG: hypothetical protein WDO68_05400 [Gammaproteobacteria bacterium]
MRHYTSHKPQMAADYMRNVRMGQTERGSFVLTALSRVPPRLATSAQLEDSAAERPFERRVTEQLAIALNYASTAALAAITTSSLAAFDAAVDHGVSADLCEAIARLGASESAWGDVEIAISWASSHPGNRALPIRSLFAADTAPILQEAARIFRSGRPPAEAGVPDSVRQSRGGGGGASGFGGVGWNGPREHAVAVWIQAKLPAYKRNMRDQLTKNPKLIELLMKRNAAAERYQVVRKKTFEGGRLFVRD